MTIKLDIGSGRRSSDPSFLGVDAFTDAEVQAFMWNLPYKDGTVDTIFSSNALEHVSKFDVVPTLREWKRVLKIGGKLEIIVPDLEWSCAWWLKHQQTDWSMDIIFGNQRHEGEFHKTGFTVDIMHQYLVVCGGFEIHNVLYMGNTVEDIMNDNFPDMKVNQRCFDFEILRVDDTPVAQ
jgi:predicted SAM-dependent methyltransferase